MVSNWVYKNFEPGAPSGTIGSTLHWSEKHLKTLPVLLSTLHTGLKTNDSNMYPQTLLCLNGPNIVSLSCAAVPVLPPPHDMNVVRLGLHVYIP